eukprot:TRINITY_DN4842_c0_g1_i1.p1 TRINITY_DN4842_c0_g1~~TRINITY_DN4842_c0_g1_i1.p1  ORF type:complete len:138 (+),score=21.06 TRINITY_DN4842_c0_g1_i1:368-781(+)
MAVTDDSSTLSTSQNKAVARSQAICSRQSGVSHPPSSTSSKGIGTFCRSASISLLSLCACEKSSSLIATALFFSSWAIASSPPACTCVSSSVSACGDSSTVRDGLRVGRCSPDLLICLLYTSPSPRDRTRSRMPSSA